MVRPKLGTTAWRDWVFSSAPARDPRGRSRPTQRYAVLDPQGTSSVAEGGNTAVTRSLLTTMIHAGVVTRIKLEPFTLNVEEHGIDAIPDVIFETYDQRLFVVETKASRYLTDAKLEKVRSVERAVNAAGMTYLFWTDAWPLMPSTWRLIREMRRCGTSSVNEQDLQTLASVIQRGQQTVQQLRQNHLYRETVLAGVWRGLIHINLLSDLRDDTVVSSNVLARGFESTLTATVNSHSWWRDLKRP